MGALPSGDSEYPEDQIILTCLPDLWNGFFVVYARGYIAPQAPLALPVEELNQGSLPDGQTIIDVLMSVGFALATTSYPTNSWAIEQAEADILQLVDYFETDTAPRPINKIILPGAFEGGLVAQDHDLSAMLIEQVFPQQGQF